MRDEPNRPIPVRGGMVVAILFAIGSFASVFFTLSDLGLTIDEPINLGHGRSIAGAVIDEPRSLLTADGIRKVWERGHEHPPLTRFLIGVGERLFDGPKAEGLNLRGGRAASAAAFAGIVFMTVRFAASLAGLTAGVASGLAVMTLPRLWAHTHLASPEVISAFFMLWAWIAAANALVGDHRSAIRRMGSILFAGVILGLALLTKLTAVLVPATVLVAVLWMRGVSSIPAWLLWSAVGSVTFIAGWPWLWPIDLPGQPAGFAGSIHRLREFLATGTERASIYVWYFGRQYAGNVTPWHFAPLFFAITTPIAVLVFGAVGQVTSLRRNAESPRRFMIAAAFFGSLAVFCLPVQRYDGERLYLFVFPLWCILAGVGGAALTDRLYSPWKSVGVCLTGILLAFPAWEIRRLHPHSLSYYNLLVGGLPGAEAKGLEPTYWGESLTPRLLEKLAAAAEPNDVAVLAPTLYAGHAGYLSSPGLAAKSIVVLPGDQVLPPGETPPPNHEPAGPVKWAILFHRTGYLIDPIPSRLLEQGETIAEESMDGVWLGRVVRLPPGWRKLNAAR